MKIKKGDNAYPFSIEEFKAGEVYTGLTKREYFAAMAMQALIANHETGIFNNTLMAEDSIKLADALIEELNK